MLDLHYRTAELTFRLPFRISVGVRTGTPVVFTELHYHGLVGYGEGSMPPYLGESHQTVTAFLGSAKKVLAGFSEPFDIESIVHAVNRIADGNTAAKASVDIALHDLVGKILGKPWYRLWELDPADTPYTTYTIGIDRLENIPGKVKDAGDYRVLKVKLGGDDDRGTIEAIRKLTDKPMAVDVNQGWSDRVHALEIIQWLKEKNTLFVEQPLPKENTTDQEWLSANSPLPIIADESFQRLPDLERVSGLFHGVNIKLMKCAGMMEAYKIISAARRKQLKILIGCMSESSCAVSAAAQLTPLAHYADLDGPLLIKEDPFVGLTFDKGKIVLPERPGIGAFPREKNN